MTLIELLVSVSVIALMGTLGGVAYSSAREKGKMAREVAAAKNLITAYTAHAADNNGIFLAGYDNQAAAAEADGTRVSSLSASRYPYRLAPYFAYKFEGTTLVNDNKAQIEAVTGFPDKYYGISLHPAFGLNYILLGGEYQSGTLLNADEVASRMSQISKPLMAFATAAYVDSGKKIEGYHGVLPPRNLSSATSWGGAAPEWSSSSLPGNFGNLDARHGGKVLCAFLDGSVRSHTVKELADMRLWSKNAVLEDNPDYAMKAPSGGGGRR